MEEMEDAVSRMVAGLPSVVNLCGGCLGNGWVVDEVEMDIKWVCSECNGTGER